MKKQFIAIVALGMISTQSIAEEKMADVTVHAERTLTPIALDQQAEMAVQSRIDDAMSKINDKLNRDMDESSKRPIAVASAD